MIIIESKNKKPSAMSQVKNKVNSGLMHYEGVDAGMVYEKDNVPGVDASKFKIGNEKTRDTYIHVINEKEDYTFQHNATPHKELKNFKPNIQPVIMYKQFKLRLDKNGNNLAPGFVFPLYVNTEENGNVGKKSQGLKIGKWYKSGEGECWLNRENNRLYTKGKGYGTDGNTISWLSYRPGWHLTTTPWGNQRGDNKVTDGIPGTGNNYLNTRNSEVWAKVEICVDIDATERAKARANTPVDQCLDKLNDREFYKYKTNGNATDDQAWYIVDTIRIVEILDDDTVDKTNDEYYADLLAKNKNKKINSNPRNYTKEMINDIPFWRMPRTNGKRYSKEDLKNMGYETAELTKINESKNMESKNDDYKSNIKSIMHFLEENGIKMKPYPKFILKKDKQKGIFIKTGYYDPENNIVVAYINDRHIKDVLRSITHELIHHNQNITGVIANNGYSGQNVKDDKELEKLESDAYLRGNIYFRKWTETMAPKMYENLKENKKNI